MNLDKALTVLNTLAPSLGGNHGADAAKFLLKLLDQVETVPLVGPFAKLKDCIDEAQMVLQLFINLEDMVFPGDQ